MNATEKLRFARQRHSAANKALNAVRAKNMVGLGEAKLVRLGTSTVKVYDQTVDANADERARLCRRSNRLLRIVTMLADRHNLSLAL